VEGSVGADVFHGAGVGELEVGALLGDLAHVGDLAATMIPVNPLSITGG